MRGLPRPHRQLLGFGSAVKCVSIVLGVQTAHELYLVGREKIPCRRYACGYTGLLREKIRGHPASRNFLTMTFLGIPKLLSNSILPSGKSPNCQWHSSRSGTNDEVCLYPSSKRVRHGRAGEPKS